MTPPGGLPPVLRLAGTERTAMRPGLERIHRLLSQFGHPERELSILHVGGTNGKGSVSAVAEAILRAAGLRTGLYTSPHLLHPAERIRVAGRPLPEADFVRLGATLVPELEAGRVSFFEAMTALAFLAFREAGVDVAVMEVGLGGRWDATNVGPPGVAALARIDYDHQEYLGTRLAEIAAEKAAIVRGGVALAAAQAPEAQAVIEAHCRAVSVPLSREGVDWRVTVLQADLAGHRVTIDARGDAKGGARAEEPRWTLPDVALGLHGLFQPQNVALAVAAVRALAARAGLVVTDEAIRAGCGIVRWPGRFQVIPGDRGRPTVVLDGAHNPAGATALAASLAHYFPGARLGLVIGISMDKDRAGMLKALAPLARRIVLTQASNPRATLAAELAADLPPLDAALARVPEPAAALEQAIFAGDVEVVCVAGSLFLVADALRWLGARGLLPAGSLA